MSRSLDYLLEPSNNSTLLEAIRSHIKKIPVTQRLHPDFKIVLSPDAFKTLPVEKHRTTAEICFITDIDAHAYSFIVDPVQTKHFDFYNPVAGKFLSITPDYAKALDKVVEVIKGLGLTEQEAKKEAKSLIDDTKNKHKRFNNK